MSDLADIVWTGIAPSAGVSTLLAERGIRIRRNPGRHAHRPLVVSTSGAARVPMRTGASAKWLWVSATKVPDRIRVEAVLRGAYDVISLGQDNAPGQIAERLRELLTPPARIPPADLIVTDSVSSKRMIEKVARV